MQCWGPNTFTQWLRFTGFLAFLYIFCNFNKSVFHNMGMEEYRKDVAKSPYHGQKYDGVQVSQETRELFGWAAFFDTGTWVVSLFFIFLMALMRQRVRQRFLIPTMCENRAGENRFCGVVEDVLCMTTCWACSLAQIARHTFALVQSDRCDPWTDPGPIESFPVMHAAPVSINSMQPQMHAVPSAQYVPPAPPGYYTPDNVQMATPARGQVVEVGQLVPGSFPAPASTGEAGVPTATVSQHSQQAHVPVAQHVSQAPQGVSRSDARV